jgi:N-formylglutamate deformylase
MDMRSRDRAASAAGEAHRPGVFIRRDATGEPAPVIFDSPHSGRDYPEDFGHAAPLEVLRLAEDAFVDELLDDAPAAGIGLLTALFPRSYIDPNRHEADIDETLLAEPWPHGAEPSGRSERGLGLLRRLISPKIPVYDRHLAVSEVENRIADFYRPYHAELKAMLDAAHARFGAVWHIDWHSMKAMGRGRNATQRSDFVLGDLDGAACSADFTQLVGQTLNGLGYSVRLNDPFKGAELVSRYSDPDRERHSLQIEINRKLYLDESSVAKTAGFARLKDDLAKLARIVADYARSSV